MGLEGKTKKLQMINCTGRKIYSVIKMIRPWHWVFRVPCCARHAAVDVLQHRSTKYPGV